MLSKSTTKSPARFAIGLAGVSALGLASLGLTASGTQAAETLKNKVEAVTGVKLGQDVPAPPAPPTAPAAPEAPVGPDGKKMEKRIIRITTDGDGPEMAEKDGKRIKKIVMVRTDGTTTETEMPDIDKILADMPQFKDGKCGGKGGEPSVEHKTEGNKKIMVICTDRIERMSVDAEKMALRSKTMGLQSALMGLKMARRSIENDSELKGEERAKALRGIDEAIAEVSKEAAAKD